MALGFIKKIFSFGKGQVEEIPTEGTPVPPKPDIPTPPPAPEPGIPQPPQQPPDEPPIPPEVPGDEPGEIPPAEPTPGIPAPEPQQPPREPSADILPPLRQPAPVVETHPVLDEVAPEPEPVPPPRGKEGVERSPPGVAEDRIAVETPPSGGSRHLSVKESDNGEPSEAPSSEVMPPIRQPVPIESDPVRGVVASELAPLPPLDGKRGRATAGSGEPELEAPAPSRLRRDASPPIGRQKGATLETPTTVSNTDTVGKAVLREADPEPPAPAPALRQGWLQRLKTGLARSSRELSDSISGALMKRRLTDEVLQDLEDVLIRADLGMDTALRITDALSAGRYGRDTTEADVRAVMAREIEKALEPVALPLELDLSRKPHVVLVVGVNGTGKTTTIGKLAAKLTAGGLAVMMAAGDTFRAAAIEQLKIWGERTASPVVASKLGADAAGLAYDAYEEAKAAGSDVLIIDTAGRLQNKSELMAELEKIVRVLRKHDPAAPHTVLQTVDATTGQNALNQVEIFRNVAGVNGLVMTKLDGTARGGILVAIAAKHGLPVYFIGVGEQVDDLEPFSASDFAKAIAGVA
jgi:fused signal recognition particle receptor